MYIDFNIDGDFFDAGEDLGVINIPPGSWNPWKRISVQFQCSKYRCIWTYKNESRLYE